jgi:hypothetical protein
MITPPAPLPIRRIQWQLRQPHQVNRSGWTGRRQVSTTPGAAMWTCSAEFTPIIGQANARMWRGFFSALNGQANYFPVVMVEAAQHVLAEVTVISGNAGENTAVLSAYRNLEMGDFVTLKLASGGYQPVCLTGDQIGGAITFMPPLRENAATGAGSAETRLPFAHVALTDDVVQFAVDAGQSYGFSFTAEEAF